MARVTKEHNLAVINPFLAKEWHPTRNRDLSPHDVTPHSDKKVTYLFLPSAEELFILDKKNES